MLASSTPDTKTPGPVLASTSSTSTGTSQCCTRKTWEGRHLYSAAIAAQCMKGAYPGPHPDTLPPQPPAPPLTQHQQQQHAPCEEGGWPPLQSEFLVHVPRAMVGPVGVQIFGPKVRIQTALLALITFPALPPTRIKGQSNHDVIFPPSQEYEVKATTTPSHSAIATPTAFYEAGILRALQHPPPKSPRPADAVLWRHLQTPTRAGVIAPLLSERASSPRDVTHDDRPLHQQEVIVKGAALTSRASSVAPVLPSTCGARAPDGVGVPFTCTPGCHATPPADRGRHAQQGESCLDSLKPGLPAPPVDTCKGDFVVVMEACPVRWVPDCGTMCALVGTRGIGRGGGEGGEDHEADGGAANVWVTRHIRVLRLVPSKVKRTQDWRRPEVPQRLDGGMPGRSEQLMAESGREELQSTDRRDARECHQESRRAGAARTLPAPSPPPCARVSPGLRVAHAHLDSRAQSSRHAWRD
ncbi:hypothetical protein C0Q70_08554 [Pomacea canaliculata]|uniref:Uncharacterized protein n=1 Tax=Pomacea canaliculata TaxID=400727 RepID=A0A2T7PI56_POMCA|nr:hypothetical protein C0Q70_08554 [Pomacea canaliculata]